MTTETVAGLPESSPVPNAKAYWVFQDKDHVKWPTYHRYTEWCKACANDHRYTKFEAIDTWCHEQGVEIPPEVRVDNETHGWHGHKHEMRPANSELSSSYAKLTADAFNGTVKVHQSPSLMPPIDEAERDAVKREHALKASLSALLVERKTQHGDFTDHARCAVALKTVFDAEVRNRLHRGQDDLTPTQLEACHMILHKMARIVAGNTNHADHWDDIAGYATIARERNAR